MIQMYIKGASKKALNEKIEKGEAVYGIEYKLGDENTHKLQDMPTGTSIKVFEKYSMGSPYAKSYGTWNKEKNKIL
jgi:hypothetical protein